MNDEIDVVFDYNGVQARVTDEAIFKGALEELGNQMAEAEELEESRDGYPFCGCSTCYDRITSGYWISWCIKMVREGKILI